MAPIRLDKEDSIETSADDRPCRVDVRRRLLRRRAMANAGRAQGFTVTIDCGGSSAAQIRTTLYFGLSRQKGSVSELEWQLFLRDEVTRRFTEGLTVWQAEGRG